MSDFKLLAIRPTTSCDSKFLKNLTENHIYKFYNDFQFQENKIGEVIGIINESTVPNNLFGENISVSAIVGKNGSGKSALIELFVACLNQFSYYLHNNKLSDQRQIVTDAELESIEFSHNSLGINAEIFFLFKKKFYVLKIYRNTFHSLNDLSSDLNVEKSKLKSFFYTLIINYSIYSFNPHILGRKSEFGISSNHWIDGLFHKNDSYQIPVVINPKRESARSENGGTIDMNNEQDLVQQRLLYNVLKYKNHDNTNNLNITENRKASSILKDVKSFSNVKLFQFQNGNIILVEEIKEQKTFWRNAVFNTLNNAIQFNNYEQNEIPVVFWRFDEVLIKTLLKFELTKHKNPLIEKCYEYIVYKIFSICEKYPDYKIFKKGNNKNEITIDITGFLKYIYVKKNRSHITNKLLQVLHYIKFYDLVWFEYDKKEIDIVELSKQLAVLSNEQRIPLIELLPPPIFSLKIELESILEPGKEKITVDKLSSGEQQLIHSTSTIFYHLNNIYSVKATSLINKYNCINLIFDEIELYFHPEYQRKFLKSILDGLKNNQFDNIKINILFVTHSPFILSDIPSENILKLDEGKVVISEVSENTFGANIHDLLANDFFLKDGFMGDFAKSKINEIINYLNYRRINNQILHIEKLIDKTKINEDISLLEKQIVLENNKLKNITIEDSKINKEYCEKLIEIVGEPMLSSSLMELFTEAYPEEKKNYLSAQIARLSNLMKKNDSDT